MRRTQMVLGLVLLLVGAWPANAQQKVLYQAPVTVSQAEVRSGPSDKPEMYVTSCLGQGQVVQVVEELEGGWLAIVPPAGSCSYVNSRFLQKTSSPYIWTVVTHEDAPVRVRIGSLCKVDQRSVQGPPLQRGAQVIATGAPNTYDQEGEWVQIRWVTGEKRYIRKEAIAKAAPAAPLKPVPAVTASAEEKEPTTLPPVPKARPAVSNNTAKKDSNLAPLPEGHPVTPVPVTAPDSSKVSPSPLEAHPAVKPPPPPVVNPAPVASSQVDPLLQMQQEAQELERANDLVKASQRYAELGAKYFNSNHDLAMQYFNHAEWLRRRRPNGGVNMVFLGPPDGRLVPVAAGSVPSSYNIYPPAPCYPNSSSSAPAAGSSCARSIRGRKAAGRAVCGRPMIA